METKGTVIGLGTEKPGSKLEELKKKFLKKMVKSKNYQKKTLL